MCNRDEQVQQYGVPHALAQIPELLDRLAAAREEAKTLHDAAYVEGWNAAEKITFSLQKDRVESAEQERDAAREEAQRLRDQNHEFASSADRRMALLQSEVDGYRHWRSEAFRYLDPDGTQLGYSENMVRTVALLIEERDAAREEARLERVKVIVARGMATVLAQELDATTARAEARPLREALEQAQKDVQTFRAAHTKAVNTILVERAAATARTAGLEGALQQYVDWEDATYGEYADRYGGDAKPLERARAALASSAAGGVVPGEQAMNDAPPHPCAATRRLGELQRRLAIDGEHTGTCPARRYEPDECICGLRGLLAASSAAGSGA